MGRSRDVGDPSFATVTETAEALGVTGQAIYNRIKANTIPYEQHVDEATGRPSYRIPREWLDREVQRRASSAPASSAELAHEGEVRAAEIIATFIQYAEAIRNEVEVQHTKIEPVLIELKGQLETIENNQTQIYKQVREFVARAEEENRRESEYQERNLQLQEENLKLLRETKDENDKARAGNTERRAGAISKRTVYVLAAVLIASVWITTLLLVIVHLYVE